METPEQFWSRHTVHDQPFTSKEESEEYNRNLYMAYPMSRELLGLDKCYWDQSVLDYGCGPGNDTIEFLKGGALVVAADISKKALDIAVARAKLYNLNKRAMFRQVGSDGYIELKSGTIDHAHCNGVLHHIKDPKPQIDEMYRLLRPGGYATMMIYNRESVFYHLYVAYILRFLSSAESGVKLSDDYTPDNPVDHVFSQVTDGKDCPISKAYRQEDFFALLPGRRYYGGGFCCSLDLLPFAGKFIARAVNDSRLEDEHREFLSAVEYRGWIPYHKSMPCGGDAVYYMTKDTK